MAIQKFSKFVAEASAADYVVPKDDDQEVKGYKPRSKGEEDFANAHMVQKTDYYAVPGQDHIFNGTIKEGLEDNEDNPANRQHLCAKNVVHEKFGEGVCMSEEHAEPDENGHVEWYDVLFKHGLERQVPVAEMKVTKAEDHMHASKKPKARKMDEEVELVEGKVMDMVMRFGKEDEKRKFRGYVSRAGSLNPSDKNDMNRIIAVVRSRAKAKGALGEEVELVEGKVMDALQKIVKNKSAGKVKFANGKTLQVDMTTANAMLNMHKKINDKNKAKMEDQIEKSPDVFMKLMDLAFGGK